MLANRAVARLPLMRALSSAAAAAPPSGLMPRQAPAGRDVAEECDYRIRPGTDYAVARAKAFAPHADALWMETAKPILAQAADFAAGVKAAFPDKKLAYNLSPSFNWDSEGLFDSDAKIESYTGDLAALGYVWQFITLAGFHSNGLVTHNFVQDYATRGMLAYVEGIQRMERTQQR